MPSLSTTHTTGAIQLFWVSEGRRGLDPELLGEVLPHATWYNRTCFCCRLLAFPLSLPVPHRHRHEPGITRGHARWSAARAARLPPLRRLPATSHVTLIALPPLTYCGPWPTLLRAWAPRQDGYRDELSATVEREPQHSWHFRNRKHCDLV